jgi:hypothetical protein
VLKTVGLAAIGGSGVVSGVATGETGGGSDLAEPTEVIQSFEQESVGDVKPASPWYLFNDAGLHEVVDSPASEGEQAFRTADAQLSDPSAIAIDLDLSNFDKILFDCYAHGNNPIFGNIKATLDNAGFDSVPKELILWDFDVSIRGRDDSVPIGGGENRWWRDFEIDISDRDEDRSVIFWVDGDNDAVWDNIRIIGENGGTGENEDFTVGNPQSVTEPFQIVPFDNLSVEFPVNLSEDVTLLFNGPDYISFKESEKEASSSDSIIENTLQISGPDNTDIKEKIIDPEGAGRLPTDSKIPVNVDVVVDGSVVKEFELTLQNSGGPGYIEYPDYSQVIDIPDTDEDNFYLDGDSGFHNPEEILVREWAIRAGGYERDINQGPTADTETPLPRNPQNLTDHVAKFVFDYINPKAGKNTKEDDNTIAGWFDNELMGPDNPYFPDSFYLLGDECSECLLGHICIENTYYFTSMLRTLGVPCRELTCALSTGTISVEDNIVDATFNYQEAAAQVFYNNSWNFYDVFISAVETEIDDIVKDPTKYFEVGHKVYRIWKTDKRVNPEHDFALQAKGIEGVGKVVLEGVPAEEEQWTEYETKAKEGFTIHALSPVQMTVEDEQGRGLETTMTPPWEAPQINSNGIPGSVYIPEGLEGFASADDTSSTISTEEGIFIPNDTDTGEITITYTGTSDGDYTTGLAQQLRSENEDTQFTDATRLSFIIKESETHKLKVATDDNQIQVQQLPAIINFDPDTLNKKKGGKWITTYVELPKNNLGVSVEDIEISSVELNGVSAVSDNKYGFVSDPEIKDRDDDGFPELMMKFPRKDVEEELDIGDNVEVTVTGDVGDNSFEGTDTIRVINSGNGDNRGGSGGGNRR